MAKKREHKFHIWLQGGTIKSTRIMTPETKAEKASRKARSRLQRNPRGTTPFQNHPGEIQVAYRNRAISRLLQVLYTIKNRPEIFVSLTLDKTCRYTYADDFKKAMSIFFKELVKRYSMCWFIYKVEYSRKSGLHFHLLGELLTGAPHIIEREERCLEELWAGACLKANLKSHSVAVRTAVDAHRGYLTKPKKLKGDIACMKRLNGRRMHGKVNPEIIRYHEVTKDILSEEEFANLVLALIGHDKDTAHTPYYAKQALHQFGAIRRLDRKALMSIYNDVKNADDSDFLSDLIRYDDDEDDERPYKDAAERRVHAKWGTIYNTALKGPQRRRHPVPAALISDLPDEEDDHAFFDQVAEARLNEIAAKAARNYANAEKGSTTKTNKVSAEKPGKSRKRER